MSLSGFINQSYAESEAMKLRNKDINDIALALKELDNNEHRNYKFKGSVRIAIGHKLRIATEHSQELEKARRAMVKDYGLGKTKVDSKGDIVPADDPETSRKFMEEYAEIMDTEVEIEIGKFLEADLDFETNQIPGSVIAALIPIITFKAS